MLVIMVADTRMSMSPMMALRIIAFAFHSFSSDPK